MSTWETGVGWDEGPLGAAGMLSGVGSALDGEGVETVAGVAVEGELEGVDGAGDCILDSFFSEESSPCPFCGRLAILGPIN